MSFRPIVEATALELRPEAHPELIVIDGARAQRVAARRGLHPLTITDANEVLGAHIQLDAQDAPESDPPPESEPADESLTLWDRAGDLLNIDYAELLGRQPGARDLVEFAVEPSSYRYSHGVAPTTIGIDLVTVESVVVDKVGALADDPRHSVVWAQVLNAALIQGIRQAALYHNTRRPEGEQRLARWLLPAQFAVLLGPAAYYASEVRGAALGVVVGAISSVVMQNSVRAAFAAREGESLNDFCWSVAPLLHWDRALCRLPVHRPLIRSVLELD